MVLSLLSLLPLLSLLSLLLLVVVALILHYGIIIMSVTTRCVALLLLCY